MNDILFLKIVWPLLIIFFGLQLLIGFSANIFISWFIGTAIVSYMTLRAYWKWKENKNKRGEI